MRSRSARNGASKASRDVLGDERRGEAQSVGGRARRRGRASGRRAHAADSPAANDGCDGCVGAFDEKNTNSK